MLLIAQFEPPIIWRAAVISSRRHAGHAQGVLRRMSLRRIRGAARTGAALCATMPESRNSLRSRRTRPEKSGVPPGSRGVGLCRGPASGGRDCARCVDPAGSSALLAALLRLRADHRLRRRAGAVRPPSSSRAPVQLIDRRNLRIAARAGRQRRNRASARSSSSGGSRSERGSCAAVTICARRDCWWFVLQGSAVASGRLASGPVCRCIRQMETRCFASVFLSTPRMCRAFRRWSCLAQSSGLSLAG